MNFFEFAAFFPCFAFGKLVKYACKVTSSKCLDASVWMQYIFTAVHKALPKCMPKRPCVMCRESRSAFRTCPVQIPRDRGRSLYRGFESRRVPTTVGISPVVWFLPAGQAKRAQLCRRRKNSLAVGGSRMQALPAYGYRAVSSRVRSLGFPP